jgi:transposase
MPAHCPADWVTRYGRRVDDYHLPTKKAARQAYAQVIGTDGHTFLAAL